MTQFTKVQASKSQLLSADIIAVAISIIVGLGIIQFIGTANAPYLEQTKISTSLSALPGYALLSLMRSLLALVLSYIFAIIYGTLAATNKTLEKILIPLLDVLQSLPVVAFLPGFVVILISIFHNSRWGLEFACLLTIFTGQVWNLAFAYYESRRTLQPELNEVAKIYRLPAIQKFFFIDLPNSYRPLIYNGMMSMAGGWFFLTTCEDFSLGNKDFKLPGLGSYLAESFAQRAYLPFVAGLIMLALIVIGTDFLIWKPLIAWVTRFRDGDDGKKIVQENWFLNIIHNTRLQKVISQTVKKVSSFFFTKEKYTTGDTRRSLINNINRWEVFLTSNKLSAHKTWENIKKSSILTSLITFAVGGLVFTLLPKLPTLGQSMSTVSNKDWFEIIHGVLLTGLKVLLVIIVSTLWTLPVGLLIGLNSRLEKIIQPIIQNLAAFPAPVLFPLIAMLLYKTSIPYFIDVTLLMCIGSQWYILFNVIGGASRIPADLKLVTKIYRLSTWNKFRKLYFPAILPSLATGWITAAGGAWNASIVAEIVSFPGGNLKSEGIGAIWMETSAAGNYPKLIASIICTIIALIIINRTIWRSIGVIAERVKD